MTTLRIYNAAGTGLQMTRGPALTDAFTQDPEITREVDLGGGRYLVSAKLPIPGPIDNGTILADLSGIPRIEAMSLFDGSARALDWTNIDATLPQLNRGPAAVFDGNDRITGNGYADRILGFGGDDLLVGNGGHDRMVGGSGDDRLYGGAGNDALAGSVGADLLKGGGGGDRLAGGGGSDRLSGARGDDRLSGGSGHDRLAGGGGDDRLSGGGQSDRLDGGSGDDLLSGGRGADVFVFTRASGRDTVTDFGRGDDVLRIESGATSLDDLSIRTTRDGVSVTFADTDIRLQGVDRADPGEDAFLFV